LATRPLTVTPVSATLLAPAEVAAGGNLAVTWTGPDYSGDYIAIAHVGARGEETYSYTSDGSPLIVKAPTVPGPYELRYVMGQDARVLQSQPLLVK